MDFSSINIVLHVLCFLLIFSSIKFASAVEINNNLQTYIVHVRSPVDSQSLAQKIDLESYYRSFLSTVAAVQGGESSSSTRPTPPSALVYSYKNIFNGFAAKLSAEQVKLMEKIPGFISAQPEEVISLHTTRSSSFMGLFNSSSEKKTSGGGGVGGDRRNLWNKSGFGKGVIIGMLDTGVDPDHPSFSDVGMPPPPKRWKGNTCEFPNNPSKTCNNKIIGARFFTDDLGNSTSDHLGHGTHTASTAAGNFVRGANLFGNAMGTASGVAPLAHLAIYKVCSTQCLESAILAGIDSAISDGVDVLSLSLGAESKPFHVDNIAFGAYTAVQRGIFVSCSAGNSGPEVSSVANEAPWILTVGASGIDRNIISSAKLGNGEELNGQSAYQPKDFPLGMFFPMIYPGRNDNESKFCSFETLEKIINDVKGKIVVCNLGVISPVDKGKNVKKAGGIGMILINSYRHGYTTFSDGHVLPATNLDYVDGLKVLNYINSTRSPTASFIFKGTSIGDDRAPTVAYFSSRGPSIASPGILKPDIIGPGLNILAAWPKIIDPDTTTSNFNILSGTSMSCPHLSGVAALLKSYHPDWSPAAIKSAIITTAEVVSRDKKQIADETLTPANYYVMGAGHVNPSKANNPGLIYDIEPDDYIPYLCGLNYSTNEVDKIVQKPLNCSVTIPEAQLNYPSFSIYFGAKVQKYSRTVTNVGEAFGTYTVQVVPPANVNVTVNPKTLKFSNVNEKLTYEVTFSTNVQFPPAKPITSQGFLSWNSPGKYKVKSPIVATING